jgi:nucleoid-associated protein YgaU
MSDKDYDDEYEEDVENSADDEYEDDADASDEEAIDGTGEAADGDMEHVEWGFETRKRRFSKEVVLGLGGVLCLVAIFGFVVHNQFSGSGEEVVSTDGDHQPGPDGTPGTESDPRSANDPFDESNPANGDSNAAQLGAASVVQNEPSPDGRLNDLLSDQFEPGIDGQAAGSGAADAAFGATADPFGSPEAADSTAGTMNVASRDSVFGGPAGFESQPASDPFGASEPFGTEPASASSLPEPDSLLSQNDPSGLGASQPAAMLPDGDLLTGGSSVSAGDSAADLAGGEPFGSQPAVSSGSQPASERPRGLFDDGPVGGSSSAGTALTGNRGDAFDSGFSSESSLEQPGGLNAPLVGDSGFASDPTGLPAERLPAVVSRSGLPDSDPFGQPGLVSSETPVDSTALGDDSLIGGSAASPVMLGNDLQTAEPFGTEPAGDFQTPVVAGQSDPFGGDGLSSPSRLDPPGGFGSATGSTTTIRPRPVAETLAPAGSTYTVAESDSFWSISKKVYGTSRYFEALQKYNRAKVDDPKKLKPGMVLDTPSASILADYLDGGVEASPQAIADGGRSGSGLPTAASSLPATVGTSLSTDSPAGFSGGILPIEPAGEAETVQTVASSPSATTVGDSTKAGFFIGNQGYPMYRVENGDTLTAIAADHLGRASRWKQIFRMNQDALKSPDDLAPGLVLKLPGDASRVPLIDRTSSLR